MFAMGQYFEFFPKQLLISNPLFSFSISPGSAILNNCVEFRLPHCFEINSFCITTMQP